MKKTVLAALAASLACTTAAFAADVPVVVVPVVVVPEPMPVPDTGPQWYTSVFGGLALATTITGEYYPPDLTTLDLQTERGFLVGGAIGVRLGALRAEAEVTYVRRAINDPSLAPDPAWCGAPEPNCDARGTLSTLFAFANAWLHPIPDARISPYVGGGIGYARVMPRISLYEGGGSPPFDTAFDVATGAFAWQFGAGVAFAVSDSLSIDLGYRLRTVSPVTFRDADPTNPQSAYDATDVRFRNQGLQLGATITF